MRSRTVLALGMAALAYAWSVTGSFDLGAQGAAALTGIVSSANEGNMEGVVVSARRDGSTFTVSVVTDAQGRYSVPRTHAQPGKYAVTIRAVGYDLESPASVDVPSGKPATLNLRLRATKDLASQLSSLEWITSMPGAAEQKNRFAYQALSCAYCHSFEKVTKSTHSAEQMVPVITRMQQVLPRRLFGEPRRARPRAEGDAGECGRRREGPEVGHRAGHPESGAGGVPGDDQPEWRQDGVAWNELKPLPRPKGKGTRVIITQWDLPRRDTVVHDIDTDSKGNVWYSDESGMFIGKFEPAANRITEYPLPAVPAGDLPGARDMQVDRDDNVWFPMRQAGGRTILTKFDTKTQQLTTVEGAGGQFMARGPDGKIWAGFKRINPKTATVEATFSWNKAPNLPPGPHGAYADLVEVDSKGNPWTTDFRGSYIIGVNAETGAATFVPTPTRNSMPRRGRIDAQDRFWFAEYTGDRLGMLDLRTLTMQEWPLEYKYTQPYTVSVPDRQGRVYASSNMSERVLRLDPKTGEIVEYQMPTDFDSKKINHDPTTARPVLYMANTRNARLVRIEPLD